MKKTILTIGLMLAVSVFGQTNKSANESWVLKQITGTRTNLQNQINVVSGLVVQADAKATQALQDSQQALTGLEQRPTYQVVTGIVDDAIAEIPAQVETDPVWATEKINYPTFPLVTGIVDSAIADIPAFTEVDPVWATEKSGYPTFLLVTGIVDSAIADIPATVEADPIALQTLADYAASNKVTKVHDSKTNCYFQTLENGTSTTWIIEGPITNGLIITLSEDFFMTSANARPAWTNHAFPFIDNPWTGIQNEIQPYYQITFEDMGIGYASWENNDSSDLPSMLEASGGDSQGYAVVSANVYYTTNVHSRSLTDISYHTDDLTIHTSTVEKQLWDEAAQDADNALQLIVTMEGDIDTAQQTADLATGIVTTHTNSTTPHAGYVVSPLQMTNNTSKILSQLYDENGSVTQQIVRSGTAIGTNYFDAGLSTTDVSTMLGNWTLTKIVVSAIDGDLSKGIKVTDGQYATHQLPASIEGTLGGNPSELWLNYLSTYPVYWGAGGGGGVLYGEGGLSTKYIGMSYLLSYATLYPSGVGEITLSTSFGSGAVGKLILDRLTANSIVASNLVYSYPKFIDEKISGLSLSPIPAVTPTVVPVVTGSEIYGLGFDVGNKASFTIQVSHGVAHTNTVFQQFIYGPHLHVSATEIGASASNATVVLAWQVAPANQTFSAIQYRTNTVSFAAAGTHNILDFGLATNNALSGADSAIIRGTITRIAGSDDLGANDLIIDSSDFHMPVNEFGSVNINGD